VPKDYKVLFNPLALELDIYSLAHRLCKMRIFYEPRGVTLRNTRHFVEEQTKMVTENLKKYKIYLFTKYLKRILCGVAVRLSYI